MSTINRLSSVDVLQPSDQIPVWDSSNGDTRKASMSTLLAFVESYFADPDYSTRIVAPAVDYFTVDIGATGDSIWMIVNPTLNFTNGAITLPPATSAVNDQQITVVFTSSVSTFVITSSGATVLGAPTQINGYDSFSVRYNSAQQTWYNIGTTGSGSGSGVSQIVRQDFTGDGTTTTFALLNIPSALGNELQIFIDGVYQERAGYTVSGVNIIFSEAPPALSNIEVLGWAVSIGAETSSDLVSYTPAGTGAVLTTVQAKLRETVSVLDFGADPTGATDSTAAIQAALDSIPNGASSYAPSKTSGGAGRVTLLFPSGNYTVNATIDCSQRDYVQMIGEGRVTIYSSSTSYIIDMSSTDHCVMNNINLYSGTARVGIYIDRCTTNPYAQYNMYENVVVTLLTNIAANSGNGRIGIWNGRGELNIFKNVKLFADLPLYSTNADDAAFSPTSGSLDTAITSSVVNTFIACLFISHTVNTPCMVMRGSISHEFIDCYWRSDNIGSGVNPYAVVAYGITSCKFSGTVEALPSFMLIQESICYFNVIDIAFQNNLDGRGIVQIEDAAANVGYVAGSVTVGVSGVIPAGTAIIKCSASSLSNIVKGVLITSISSVTPIGFSTVNSAVTGNTVNNEAGTTITGGSVKPDTLGSTFSGLVTASVTATTYTIVETSAFFVYQVFAYLYSSGGTFVSTATFINDGTVLSIKNADLGTYLSLTVSGTNIQATQTSGGAADIVYKVIRII